MATPAVLWLCSTDYFSAPQIIAAMAMPVVAMPVVTLDRDMSSGVQCVQSCMCFWCSTASVSALGEYLLSNMTQHSQEKILFAIRLKLS